VGWYKGHPNQSQIADAQLPSVISHPGFLLHEESQLVIQTLWKMLLIYLFSTRGNTGLRWLLLHMLVLKHLTVCEMSKKTLYIYAYIAKFIIMLLLNLWWWAPPFPASTVYADIIHAEEILLVHWKEKAIDSWVIYSIDHYLHTNSV